MREFDHHLFERCRELRQESERLKEQARLVYKNVTEMLSELREIIARSEDAQEKREADRSQLVDHPHL
jgi:hypothetical protein